MKKFTHLDIYFAWENNTLTLGNSSFQRIIDWSLGLPKTLSMLSGNLSVAIENSAFDFRLAGFPEPGNGGLRCAYQVVDTEYALLQAPDGNGAKFTVTTHEPGRELTIKITYIVYPELPVMAVESEICSAVTPMLYWHERQRSKTFQTPNRVNGSLTIVDALQLTDFQAVKSVEFQMRTDYFDEPVLEHFILENEEVFGNILLAENPSHAQFFFLQEAPPSMERRGNEPGDFLVNGSRIASLGSGITPDDILPGRVLRTNRVVCGVALDGNGAKLIKQYLRLRQAAASKVYGAITVNPWGCGCFPKLLNEDFLKAEIAAAGKLGADTYQIDDGYQHGGLADMAVHNQKLDAAYWTTRDDLLPEGFAPLVELAKASNIKLSLWFAPSLNQAYMDWQTSCDILINHWQNSGFESFKLDGVIFNSYTAEENFGKLLQALHNRSNGEITVNLDVTNGTRGGLWKFAEYGLIFLENRYCCHRWVTHPYHPGNTLNNVWNLAKYCRIQNLQIEVPSPDNINVERYTANALPLPTEYDFAYWAMIPMFASPLLWLTPSQLAVDRSKVLAEIMAIQKKYRNCWRDSLITPIGGCPDGKSITGLYADTGYLLIFRETTAPESAVLELPDFTAAEVLYSTAPVELSSAGKVFMPVPGSAALLRLQ